MHREIYRKPHLSFVNVLIIWDEHWGKKHFGCPIQYFNPPVSMWISYLQHYFYKSQLKKSHKLELNLYTNQKAPGITKDAADLAPRQRLLTEENLAQYLLKLCSPWGLLLQLPGQGTAWYSPALFISFWWHFRKDCLEILGVWTIDVSKQGLK